MLTVDGGTRTVGELKLTAPGAFTIGASSGVLKINTGITAKPSTAATYVIDAPITMGTKGAMSNFWKSAVRSARCIPART